MRWGKMRNKTLVISGLLIIGLIGIVSAHGGYGMMDGYFHSDYGYNHEIEEIFETGTYSDLEALREEYNMPMMPWIDSEEEFESEKIRNEGREGWGCH
jgi:hypothetical protein